MIFPSKKAARIMTPLLLVFTCINWGNSLWIYGKASLAQVLVKHAWQQTLESEDKSPVRPWSWADTWPVAELYIESTGEKRYVLAGGQGSSLAFGPGHLDGSAVPGERGTAVFSGHRDTHFGFLAEQKIGNRLTVLTADGRKLYYVVIDRKIHDTHSGPWLIDSTVDELHLVTCYPFDSLVPGGSLRHITIAKKIGEAEDITASKGATKLNTNVQLSTTF